MRQSIASQQNQAYNQLYATEDPTVAANTAATSVAGAQLSQPNLQPLNAVFTPVAIGLGTALSSPYGQYTANQMVPKSGLGQGSQTTSQT